MTPENKDVNDPLERELADKVFDINAKLLIAEHVVVACAAEFKVGRKNPSNKFLKKIEFYTGIKNVDVNILKNTISTVWDEKLQRKHLLSMSSAVHQALVTCYIVKETIATKSNLIDALPKNTFDETIINTLLKNKILIYQRLAKMKQCIITENPQLVWQRQRYAKKMAEYRAMNRLIIYISRKDITKLITNENIAHLKGTNSQSVFIAASSRDGLIDSVCQLNNNKDFFEQWLIDVILPCVSDQTVFVFEGKPDSSKNATPNISSSKKYISEWLQKFNVPHSPEWHKADLFALVKKYNQVYSKESNTLGNMLKGKGHDVLWTPFGFTELNYFNCLWSETTKLCKNQTISNYVETIIENINSYAVKDWKLFETALQILEVKIYREDIQMENIIDGLMTMARDKAISQMDLPVECSEYFKEYVEDRFNDNIKI